MIKFRMIQFRMMRSFFKKNRILEIVIRNSQNKQYFSTDYVASIDQSTTSTKFSVFSTSGRLIDQEIIEHEQYSPHQGFLEHDAKQIMRNVHESTSRVIQRLTNNSDFSIDKLKGVGICNQRQTIVCWDKNGEPLHNAIVWCDARTKQVCEKFKNKFGEFKNKTGLPISTYFSLFKIIWLLENVPTVREHFERGDIRFGTMDSWVVYNLTGKYVTDASNASRTYLSNLQGQWDDELLALYAIKRDFLPQIVDSFSNVGIINSGVLKGIPVSCILGDQQSSAYAHSLQTNQMKITYGTGCFLLNSIGKLPKIHPSFITTILSKHKGEVEYGYEAAVECGGGTLNWAKRIGFFNSYHQLNKLQVPENDIIFLPSFGSVFAPYWRDGVQGGFFGLNFNTKRQDLLYSILESIVFRLQDNLKDKQFDLVKKIVTDGGMTKNKMFMEMNANMFNRQVEVCQLDTCWGVAKGVLTAQNIQHPKIQKLNKIYSPNACSHEKIQKRYKQWNQKRMKLYNWQ